MKRLSLCIILAILILPLFAQNFSVNGTINGHFSYNGYNENSPLYIEEDGNYYLSNYLSLNTEFFFGELGVVFAYLNLDARLEELLLHENNDLSQLIDTELNEAYLSVALSDWLFFNLGKKRIVWGVAYTYNPSDFINPPKDPLDPEAEKRGIYCAELELFQEWFSINQIVVLYDNLEYLGYGTKLSTFGIIPHTDVNLVFYYSWNAQFNLGFSLDTTPFIDNPYLSALALHAEIGFSQKSEKMIVADPESPTPVLQRRSTRDDFYKNFITGIRYTIPFIETMLTAEYYYIDDGYTATELDDLIQSNLIAFVPLEPGKMSQHNLMINLTQPSLTSHVSDFTDTLSLSGTALINLLDASFIISARIESGIIENCIFALEMIYATGDTDTEHNVSPRQLCLAFETIIAF